MSDSPEGPSQPSGGRSDFNWDDRRDRSRNRGDPSPGRRRTDYDPRTTVTPGLLAKLIAAIVFLINTLYLAGEVLIYGQTCP